MKDFSFITNSHPAYIEGLYQDFVKNPDAVDPEFRRFFEGFDFAVTQGKMGANGSPRKTAPPMDNGTLHKNPTLPATASTGKRNSAPIV